MSFWATLLRLLPEKCPGWQSPEVWEHRRHKSHFRAIISTIVVVYNLPFDSTLFSFLGQRSPFLEAYRNQTHLPAWGTLDLETRKQNSWQLELPAATKIRNWAPASRLLSLQSRAPTSRHLRLLQGRAGTSLFCAFVSLGRSFPVFHRMCFPPIFTNRFLVWSSELIEMPRSRELVTSRRRYFKGALWAKAHVRVQCMETWELKPQQSGAHLLVEHNLGSHWALLVQAHVLRDVLSPGLWAGTQPCRNFILGGIGKKEGPDLSTWD